MGLFCDGFTSRSDDCLVHRGVAGEGTLVVLAGFAPAGGSCRTRSIVSFDRNGILDSCIESSISLSLLRCFM